jgi:DNA polymerase II large subunit
VSSEEHFKTITKNVDVCYELAQRARARGFDPEARVEVPIATSLAEKAIGLISVIYPQLNDKKIINRILELEAEYGQLDTAVSFKIAEEIAKEKYCRFKDLLEAIDAGIRVGFAYITLGVVSSPLEGFTGIQVGKTREGKEYLKAYFSGPIRSAGTTASCVVLMLIDYLRETFGYEKYDPDENEVKRYVTENYDYHERVNNLQYLPSEEEILYLAKQLPIQIAGEPTEEREVSNYKDLDRVETNFIRGGMCLIFSEGLAQKAQKGLRLLKSTQAKGFKATGWDYLEGYLVIHNKKAKGKKDSGPTYIKDIVAGRPVFSHPSRSGGFRFRYGRSRTGGFSATLVHPATMGISNCFLSSGTQLKIEKPTKGCAISVCDKIDGPIVKLKNGSVKRVYDFNESKKLYPEVEEIIYLGDILFPLGDVINRNYELLKPCYVEEWWALELEKAEGNVADMFKVNFEEAVEISNRFKIPLHPRYIFYWSQISKENFFALLDWIGHGEVRDGKLVLPYSKTDKERFEKGKRALELIGSEHEVGLENVILKIEETKAFLFNLGFDLEKLNKEEFEKQLELIMLKIKEAGKEEVLEMINSVCKLKIKDKAGTFIGARMGRPEKAKLRKLTGSPHVLFPVGEQGGRLRSFQSAMEIGFVEGEFPNYYCEKCKTESVYSRCLNCKEFCKLTLSERESYGGQKSSTSDKSSLGQESPEGLPYSDKRIDIRKYFDEAKKIVGVRTDEIPLVKGVRGMSNKDHSTEFLGKGLLRARHNLNVNKDGTIRYDMTEMALTHFKPKEVGTSVEKLRSLGYKKDTYGKELTDENQIIELYPHDVILPACPDTPDEKADDVFIRIANFIDDELEKIYGVERFYKIEKKEDIVGQLVVCIAPHICTATVGRIIGFSKMQTLLASPYMHAAMRRDCDGDEAATMLLMDLLLNFSRKFLPAHRGGTQDSPLVLNTHIRAGEVDDQILDLIVGKYPLELYELAEQGKHSSEVKVDNIKRRLKEGQNPFENISFTLDCDDFNAGVVNSSYKSLPTMQEKVDAQMDLCSKLRAVDITDVSRLVIERHFIRDTRGNLRKFSMQGFRCVGCNGKFRRVPLCGKCTKCGGKIIFTITEGSILKYMQPALELARKYHVSLYLLESLELTEMYIQSIFGKEKEKQESIGKWF